MIQRGAAPVDPGSGRVGLCFRDGVSTCALLNAGHIQIRIRCTQTARVYGMPC